MLSAAMESIDESSISSNTRMLACTSGKQRKKRCNSAKPQCDLCRRLGVRCVYPRFSFKPGPKKKQAFTAISRTEEPIIVDSYIHPCEEYGHFPSPPRDGHPIYNSSMSGPGTTDTSSIQHNQGRSDRILDPNLFNPLAIFDESLVHKRVPSISSDATNSDPSGLLGTLLLDQNTDPFRVALPTINPPSPELPSTEIITHLVDVFFNAVHPQFRLLHRPTLAQKLHDPSYLASKEAALLLNAIFALAARYSNDIRVELFDQSLLRHQSDKSSPSNTSILNPSYQRKGRWELGQGFLQRANRFLREEIAEEERLEHKTGESQEPRVELLQAAALLAFAELGMGISSRAHSIMSMCARMAYDMGLDSIDCEDFQSQLEPSLNKHSWIRKEELRRLWWCIWDLDNFMCTAKYRPRMICPVKCKTKLPVNDVDWFDGNEVPSFFLPSNVRQLPEFIQNHLLSSAAAYRIINCHLLATLTDMFSNIENLDEPSDIYSVVKVCTVLWKENLPKEFKDYSCKVHAQEPGEHSEIFSDLFPMHIYCELVKLLLGTERMFIGITPAAISTYCQQYSDSSIGLAGIDVNPKAPSPPAQAFFNALSASKAICSIVRDWPSKYIIHTSPLVGGGILMAAFVQLLVKRFARGSDMAETASLSLRLLIMVVEQLGEYWGLCRTKLSSFRAYESKLYDIVEGSDEIYSETAIIPFRAFLHGCCRGWKVTSGSSLNNHRIVTSTVSDSPLELLHDGSGFDGSLWLANFNDSNFLT